MTVRRKVAQILSDLLREEITDPNTVRGALGTQWIYPDIPRIMDLSEDKNNFPRVSIVEIGISSNGDLGMGSTETEDVVTLSVDVWAYQDMAWPVTVTGGRDVKTLSGNNLCEAILRNIHIYLRDNWRTVLIPYQLYDYIKTGEMPYEDELEGTIKRYGMSIKIEGVNIND